MALVIWRPRGLSVAWPAAVGSFLMLLLGIVSYADVESVVARTWNATLALVGLMLLSSVLEANGAFRAAAHQVALRAGGSGRKLFVGLALLTAIVTAALANDGAVLILTPIVADMAEIIVLPEAATLAYLFATGFLCDALSTLLPTSNLTNILMVDTLHIGAVSFFVHLVAPWLATLVMATVALGLQFWGALPKSFDTQKLGAPPKFPARSLRATLVALTLLLIGYGAAERIHLPLGVVVLIVAVALALFEHRNRTVDALACARSLPWSIVVFATALFVIVTGVAQTGLGRELWVGNASPGSLVRMGLTVGVLTAAGNNLPVLLMVLIAFAAGGAPAGQAYAALIGANIGSKLTPIGSLATLLWLEILRQRGLRVGWGRYLTLAFVPTAVATLAALGMLALQAALW